MRLDKFLKNSRLIKRRTIAKKACDTGRVSVNGKVVKAGYEVKESDIIEIRFGERLIKAEVLGLKETSFKDDAKEMIRILED
ncbi:MAG: RNA-binding S4 domain-containing protein [Tissierellia bacterium]|nr:RNA-binding S4 domain-containing protein [Tissierellia bacterium]